MHADDSVPERVFDEWITEKANSTMSSCMARQSAWSLSWLVSTVSGHSDDRADRWSCCSSRGRQSAKMDDNERH